MLRIILNALRTGRVTEPEAMLEAPAPAGSRGRPALNAARCDGDAACAAVCPSAAISFGPIQAEQRRLLTLDYGACVFCGRCAQVCGPAALTITTDYAMAVLRRADLVLHAEVQTAPNQLESLQ